MKRIARFWIAATFIMLSISMQGQESNPNVLSYSLSYIPPSLASFEGEFSFVPIYINFEANIHYKPFELISFSSGLAFHKISESIFINYSSSSFERDDYLELFVSGIRLPLQLNLHFTKAPLKTDGYLKAVYTNGFGLHKTIQYEDNVATGTSHTNYYNPSIGIGLGSIFLKNKPMGIIVEGMIEKYLRFDSFKDATWYSLKIGVVI